MKYIGFILTVWIACGLSGWFGYKVGQERPRVFHNPNLGTDQVFGWDGGNQCVATWGTFSNSFFWTRLE